MKWMIESVAPVIFVTLSFLSGLWLLAVGTIVYHSELRDTSMRNAFLSVSVYLICLSPCHGVHVELLGQFSGLRFFLHAGCQAWH